MSKGNISSVIAENEEFEEIENEWEEEEEEEQELEKQPSVYFSEDFISRPVLSENGTVPSNIIEFDHSFGYDCKRYFNLAVIDEDNLVFSSGNFIHFFNVPEKKMTFRKSALGGGIGHIQTNPNPEYTHLAVAENGNKPIIIIYEWPSMDINCVLREGTTRIYTHLDYNPDGMLLASQGGDPDYLITIWNWTKRRILLRAKSHTNDVFRVKFSPYVLGQLTTCGIAHIKVWKMAATFTGLKLKGELGRFGKTEYSDIVGILPMPDEKVISGCSWGNILVWDTGLIKLEVFRTLRRKCHEAPIVQFFFIDGELWSIGMDGHVKIWWYEKIDQADPPDDDRVIQIEPTYDFYTNNTILMNVIKRFQDFHDHFYFAQDGNGGIWSIDLNTEEEQKPLEQLFKCHAGHIVDIATCSWGPYLLSFGEDGRLHLYNYIDKKMIFNHQFRGKGTCMIWLPIKVQETGDELILGFDDGCLRLCILTISIVEEQTNINIDQIQTIKSHSKPVTRISVNNSGTILISGGEDATIFIFQLYKNEEANACYLVPIGFIPVPNAVTYLTWHYNNDSEILVGCLHGEIVQVVVPKTPQDYTDVSFLLDLDPVNQRFKTYKAQIRRDIRIRQIEAKKAAKVEIKRKELEKVKKENPGIEIDEEVFLADSDPEEELEPLHIPEVPNRIIWMQSTPRNTIWLSMGGYDAGYIYEYKIEQSSDAPYYFRMIFDADDTEISTYTYNYNKKYLIFAMEDGTIRINKINPDDMWDFSDYWKESMHDNLNGFVSKICFSYDEKYFFTCGHDGNIFSFKFNPEEEDYIPNEIIPVRLPRTESSFEAIKDKDQYSQLSLEQVKVKAENDRIEKLANEHKKELRAKIKILADDFFILLKRNEKLLPSQVIPREELELDPRITEYLEEKLEKKLELVKRKQAYDVEKSKVGMEKLISHFTEPLDFIPFSLSGINIDMSVKILRQRNIAAEHDDMLTLIEKKLLEEELKGRPPERPLIVAKPPPPKKEKEKQIEYFLMNLSPEVIEKKLGPVLNRLLIKYRARKVKWEERREQWDAFIAKKPVAGLNSPEDEAIMLEAKKTIGDFKLKTSPDYKVTRDVGDTTMKKYKQLLITRQMQFDMRYNFNKKISLLREEKLEVRNKLYDYNSKLIDIYGEIPHDKRKDGPQVPDIKKSEFPKENLKIKLKRINDSTIDLEHAFEPVCLVSELSKDNLEKLILGKKKVQTPSDITKNIHEMIYDNLLQYSRNENADTPWEGEMRYVRLIRKLFEQDEIINFMNQEIKTFNMKLSDIQKERFIVQTDANYIDLFILTLHQELLVLKQFESIEDTLQEKVNQKTLAVFDMQDELNEIALKIKEHYAGIDKLHDQEKSINNQFMATIKDNKFSDFLQKVFKKKYKPVKVRKSDDSSSESSSSSDESDEDDTGSIDSRDFRILKQDLNVCPKGCDPTLFDLTITLRSKRHEIEITIKEELKVIELLKKDVEFINKKIRVLQASLESSQKELEQYQREKQQKLNEILCVVVFRINQIQNFTHINKMSDIKESLVFSKTRLSKLYKRVDELRDETEEQKRRHLKNVKHLTRMTTDCNFMAKEIKNLKADIVELMKIKFGNVVNINEVEEVLLKKMVYDLRMTLMDIKSMYADEMKLWKNNLEKAEKQMVDTLADNTSRHELLIFLTKEKSELAKLVASQDKKKEVLEGMEVSNQKFKEEMNKLLVIVNCQNKKIRELKEEIAMLKLKDKPLPEPKKVVSRKRKSEDEDESVTFDEESLAEWNKYKFKPSKSVKEDAEDLAAEFIMNMLQALDTSLDRRSTERFTRELLYELLPKPSVEEIVSDLVKIMKPSKDQMGIVEGTAKQLFEIQDDMTDEDDVLLILNEIIDRVIPDECQSDEEYIIYILEQLIEQLPIDVLLKSSSIDLIANKLQSKSKSLLSVKDEVLNQLEKSSSAHKEIQLILDEILNRIGE